MAVLDRGGVQTLTMRKLADELAVSPMAVYHHVATKEALLGLIVEHIFEQVQAPRPEGDWRTELGQRSRSLRAVLTRHPWALPLMETQKQPGPQNLAQHEAVLEVLRRSEFSVRAAAHAYAILDAFVYGFALQENLLGSIGLEDEPAELAQGIEFAVRPRIAEVAQLYMESDEYPFAESFEVGLAMTLDGIASLQLTFPDAPS